MTRYIILQYKYVLVQTRPGTYAQATTIRTDHALHSDQIQQQYTTNIMANFEQTPYPDSTLLVNLLKLNITNNTVKLQTYPIQYNTTVHYTVYCNNPRQTIQRKTHLANHKRALTRLHPSQNNKQRLQASYQHKKHKSMQHAAYAFSLRV